MSETAGAQRIQELVDALRSWQAIERHGIESTGVMIERTDNPLVRIVLEIIRHDSMMHHRVQQFLIDSLTLEGLRLTPEELGVIWEQIAAHQALERQSVELARRATERAPSIAHKQILEYLLTDESKHDTLLARLEELKSAIYPYA